MASYLFLDEAGNFDFGPLGTRYLVFACVRMRRPFEPAVELMNLKYDLIESGMPNLSHFHASEDRQAVRDAFFGVVRRHLPTLSVDALVVDKSLAVPGLRSADALYPWALGRLLQPVLRDAPADADGAVNILTDRIPLNRRRDAAEKAIKSTLASLLPSGTRFQILHHESRTNLNLQIADYVTWSLFRKWERSDDRSHRLLLPSMHSERLAFPLSSK